MLARKLTYDDYDYQYERTQYRYEETRRRPQPVCNTILRRQAGVLVLLVLSFAFFMVMRSDVYIQKAYELGAIQKEEGTLIKNNDHLHVRLASLRSPDRITALARGLGMVNADKSMHVKTNAVSAGTADGGAVAARVAVKKD